MVEGEDRLGPTIGGKDLSGDPGTPDAWRKAAISKIKMRIISMRMSVHCFSVCIYAG
jgi:hypothetical protein